MESSLNEFEQESRVRPAFLTVLCILTFVGSGWGIISNIYAYSIAPGLGKAFSSAGINRQFRRDDSSMQRDSVGKGHVLIAQK